MFKVHAYKRLTRKYRDGFRHLDKEEFLATVSVTPPKQLEEPKSYDDGGVIVQHARAPAGVDLKVLMQAIRDTMGGSGCQHEYDCCGCESRLVQVNHVGGRRLVVRTRITYNY
jgi:hypothetical protein